jgi:hypothetical protein
LISCFYSQFPNMKRQHFFILIRHGILQMLATLGIGNLYAPARI